MRLLQTGSVSTTLLRNIHAGRRGQPSVATWWIIWSDRPDELGLRFIARAHWSINCTWAIVCRRLHSMRTVIGFRSPLPVRIWMYPPSVGFSCVLIFSCTNIRMSNLANHAERRYLYDPKKHQRVNDKSSCGWLVGTQCTQIHSITFGGRQIRLWARSYGELVMSIMMYSHHTCSEFTHYMHDILFRNIICWYMNYVRSLMACVSGDG